MSRRSSTGGRPRGHHLGQQPPQRAHHLGTSTDSTWQPPRQGGLPLDFDQGVTWPKATAREGHRGIGRVGEPLDRKEELAVLHAHGPWHRAQLGVRGGLMAVADSHMLVLRLERRRVQLQCQMPRARAPGLGALDRVGKGEVLEVGRLHGRKQCWARREGEALDVGFDVVAIVASNVVRWTLARGRGATHSSGGVGFSRSSSHHQRRPRRGLVVVGGEAYGVGIAFSIFLGAIAHTLDDDVVLLLRLQRRLRRLHGVSI